MALFEKAVGRSHGMIPGDKIQNVHSIVTLAAVLIAGPINSGAFAADAGQRRSALTTNGRLRFIIGSTVRTKMASQNKLAAASLTGDVTAVFADINRISTIGTGNLS